MKKFKQITVAALLALAFSLTSSCNKDDDDNSGGGSTSGSYLEANVDGSQFKAEVMGHSTVSAVKIGTGANGIITVIGGVMDGTNVSINLMGITAAGTYTLNPDSDSVIAYTTAGGAAAYGTGICTGSTGTVTISTLNDEKIEGTFSFTGKDGENCSSTKSVTNGSFRGMFSN